MQTGACDSSNPVGLFEQHRGPLSRVVVQKGDSVEQAMLNPSGILDFANITLPEIQDHCFFELTPQSACGTLGSVQILCDPLQARGRSQDLEPRC